MKKIFIVILILGVFVIGVYWNKTTDQKKAALSARNMSPTPTLVMSTSEISNQSKVVNGMRQFVSTKYGFSFSYPYDWQVLDEPNVKGTEIQKVNAQGMGFSISLRINDNPQKLSLEEYAKSQAFSLPNHTQDLPEKVTIGRHEGYRLHQLPEGLIVTIYLPYKEKDKVLYIFAGGEFDKSNQTVASYNQIVNNFLNSLEFNY